MDQYHSLNDILAELEQQREKKSQLYIPIPTKPERTLILMGPIRSGKSTIVRTLENSLYQPERPTFYSVTGTPQIRQISGFRIIDMPGFNELQIGQFTLSNDSILQMLQEQMNEHHPVDLFAFVFDLNYGIKEEDIRSMIFIKSHLPDLAGRIVLVVTHAEELADQSKNRLMDEFFSHPQVRRNHLEDFFQTKIFFLGCLRYESFNQRDEAALVSQHENILNMRKKFIEKCFENLSQIQEAQQKQPILKCLSSRNVYLSILVLIVAFALVNSSSYYRKSSTTQRTLVQNLTQSVQEKIVEMESMAKTIKMQKEKLEAQSKTTDTQSKTIETKSKEIEELTRRMADLHNQVSQAKKEKEKSFWSKMFR